MPSATGPAVFAIAAPEGIRGGTQEVTSFSQQDYDKFLQGYKSQYQELSFWVEQDMIEGNSVLRLANLCMFGVCSFCHATLHWYCGSDIGDGQGSIIIEQCTEQAFCREQHCLY